jgi:hypothetical protein
VISLNGGWTADPERNSPAAISATRAMTRRRALGCYAEHVVEREAIRPALQRASLSSLSSCAGVS